MALRDITDEHVRQAVRECDKDGREVFLRNYGFRPARNYYLVYRRREYDSKAILGVAHRFVRRGSRPLTPTDFKGGPQTAR